MMGVTHEKRHIPLIRSDHFEFSLCLQLKSEEGQWPLGAGPLNTWWVKNQICLKMMCSSVVIFLMAVCLVAISYFSCFQTNSWLITAEGRLELTHNTSQAASWQFGHSKPAFPHNPFSGGGWNEMSQLCFLPTTMSNLSGRSPFFVFTIWPVPKPFSRGFLRCVPLAPGSLCDWLLGLVVAGSLLPSNAHSWAARSWQSWKWQAGFHSSVRRTQECWYRPLMVNVQHFSTASSQKFLNLLHLVSIFHSRDARSTY